MESQPPKPSHCGNQRDECLHASQRDPIHDEATAQGRIVTLPPSFTPQKSPKAQSGLASAPKSPHHLQLPCLITCRLQVL